MVQYCFLSGSLVLSASREGRLNGGRTSCVRLMYMCFADVTRLEIFFVSIPVNNCHCVARGQLDQGTGPTPCRVPAKKLSIIIVSVPRLVVENEISEQLSGLLRLDIHLRSY